MAAGMSQMNLGVVVTPYINQQALNGMASSAGATFAANFRSSMSRAGQPLGKITGQVDEFEKSMAAANARVLAFGASAGSIYLVKDAFSKIVSSTIEVEKALADINVVLALGQTELKNFSTSMFKAAAQTGQTFQTASKVALEFARHGVSAAETAKRMVSAMQLMRISGLDAAGSVNAITAAINSFNKEGLTSEDIVNRLTAVDTKFAVSAQDLAKAIERVGSTAVDAGVKFNELLGLVTAVQTATSRGGAVIGNAFKSIFTRLARPEVLSDLEAVGVTTRNAYGQILPMIEIMKKLASQYDHLSYSQKSFVSEAVGGVYQVNILKATLADLGRGLSIYDKAALAASQSTGLIEKRMSTLNETIAAKLNTSALQMTRLFSSFGQTGFGAGVKSSLDVFNKQLDSFASGLDESSDGTGIGEKIGKSIVQGITKGMGDIAAGPGVQMAANLAAKLTLGLSKFAYKSGREVLGLNEPANRQKALQQSMGVFLQKNVQLMDLWVKGQLNLNDLMAVYFQQLKNSNIAQAQLINASKGMAVSAMPSIKFGATPAGGFVPNFDISSVDEAKVERRLALAHGYEAGPVVRKVIWDGHGGAQLSSINQREDLAERIVGGHRGTTVTPPNGYGKGTIFAAEGFVANPKLVLGEGKDALFTSFYDQLKAQAGSKYLGGIGYPEAVEGRSYAATKMGHVKQFANNASAIIQGGGQAFFAPSVNNNVMKGLRSNRRALELLVENFPSLGSVEEISNVLADPTVKLSKIGKANNLAKSIIQQQFGKNKGVDKIRELYTSIADPRVMGNKALTAVLATEVKSVGGSVIAPHSGHDIYPFATFGGSTKPLNPITTSDIFSGIVDPKRLSGLLASFHPIGRRFNMGDEFSKRIGLAASGYVPSFGIDFSDRKRIYKTGFGGDQEFLNKVLSKINPDTSLLQQTIHGNRDKILDRVSPDELAEVLAMQSIPINKDTIAHINMVKTRFGNLPHTFGINAKLSKSTVPLVVIPSFLDPQINQETGLGTKEGRGTLIHTILTRNPRGEGIIRPSVDRSGQPMKFLRDDMGNVTEVIGLERARQMFGLNAKRAAGGFVPNFKKISGEDISDKDIISRLREGVSKGSYFADFYKRYESANPLRGDDRDLFNKIYASQSRGTDDKMVFNTAIKIFKGLKGGQTDFFNELRSLGTVKGRMASMRKVMAGEPLKTEKTGAYYNALSGDPKALAIDRNVIQTALGYTMKKGDQTSKEFRQRLRGLISNVIAPEMKLDPRDVQAALFAGRSKFKPTFDHFSAGFSKLENLKDFAGAEIAEATQGGSGFVPLEKSNAFALRNVSSMVGHKDAFNPSINPVELASWLSKANPKMFSKLWMNGMFNFPQQAAASGYVPSFSMLESVSQAFRREGTSTAALGAAPELKSVSNPLGLGVYDTAYQKNLSQAFAQHRAMGQTDLKNMGRNAASGYVPNFGVMESLLLGTLQGSVNNLNGVLAKQAFGYNKQIESVRKLNEAYSKAADALQSKERVLYKGKEFDPNKMGASRARREFQAYYYQQNKDQGFSRFASVRAKQEQQYQQYQEDLSKRQARVSQAGMYAMIGGPMAGEIGASMAKNFGFADLSKGLEVFSSGITTTGQLLTTFPGKLGVALALGQTFKTAADSVSMLSSGFGTMQRNFDIASTKAEKVASAGNALMESFERLRVASTDANISFRDFSAMQARHGRLLAEMRAVPGGEGISRRLTETSSESERQTIISEAVEAANREKSSMNLRMQMAQAQSNSSIFGWNFNKKSGGIFAATGETEKVEKRQLMRDIAVEMQQQLMNSKNMPKGFGNRLVKGSLSAEDIAAAKGEAFNEKNPLLEGRSNEEINLLKKQFDFQISAFQRPAGTDENDWEKHIDRLNQLRAAEMTLRERYNRELQGLLSKGTIVSAFSHAEKGFGIESKFRKGEVDTYREERSADVASLTTADAPMINIRANIKRKQVQNQLERDIANAQNKGAEGLSAVFGRTIQDFALGGLNPTGQQIDTVNINPKKAGQLKYLEQRQKYFADNPQELIKIAQNRSTFAEKFIGKKSEVSSATGEGKTFNDFEYTTLANKLGTVILGQQENIANILLSTKQITENGLNELAKIGLDQTRAIQEARFKELASGIKGIDELQRGGARKLRRELRRDEYVMGHSRSVIRRGEAARDILNYIPSDQRDRNNPYVDRLFKTATSGSERAFNYVFRGTGVQGFGSARERAEARIGGNYKSVNPAALTSGASIPALPSTAALDKSLNQVDQEIKRFKDGLSSIGSSLEMLKAQITVVSKQREDEGARYNKDNPSREEPEPGQGSMFWGSMKGIGTMLGPAIVSGLVMSLFRGGGAKVFQGGPKIPTLSLPSAASAAGGAAAAGASAAIPKALKFSYLQQLTELTKVGSFTNPSQTKTIAAIMGNMNRGQMAQLSKELFKDLGSGAASSIGRRVSGGLQITNAEASALTSAPTFQKQIANIVSGAKVSRGALGRFLLPEVTGAESMVLLKELSKGGSLASKMSGARGLASAGAAAAGGLGSKAFASLPFIGMALGGALGANSASANNMSQIEGGLLGALSGGVEKGSVFGRMGLVKKGGFADTALGFGGAALIGSGQGAAIGSRIAPGVGTAIGSGVGAVVGVGAEGYKYGRDAYIRSGKGGVNLDVESTRSKILDQRRVEKFGRGFVDISDKLHEFTDAIGEAKETGKGLSPEFMEKYGVLNVEEAERKRVALRAEQQRMAQNRDSFRAKDVRDNAMNDAIRSYGTINQLGTTYTPEAIKKQISAPQAQAPNKTNVSSTQQNVRISAEPATVIVKYTGPNGEVLQTLETKLTYLEERINSLYGTPKPASAVNSLVS